MSSCWWNAECAPYAGSDGDSVNVVVDSSLDDPPPEEICEEVDG
jgi:hypothetical protein